MEAIVFLGPPGSGKGTAAEGLVERTPYKHVSTGELFRAAVEEGGELGEAIRPLMTGGGLVPDDLVMRLVSDVVRRESGGRLLFDGFPRSLAQAEAFQRLVDEGGHRIDAVIWFAIEEADVVARLQCRRICGACGTVYNLASKAPAVDGVCDACGGALAQRPDDEADTVRERMRVYEERTAPLIAFYRTKGVLITVDANRPPAAVLRDVEARIPDGVR